MLETIAINVKPAASPAQVGATEPPVAQEGAGGSDFQGLLQTAQKSLRPEKKDAAAARKSDVPKKTAATDSDTEAADMANETEGAPITTKEAGTKIAESPQHEAPETKKGSKEHDELGKKEVDAGAASVLSGTAVLQQAVPPVAKDPAEANESAAVEEDEKPAATGVKGVGEDLGKRAPEVKKPAKESKDISAMKTEDAPVYEPESVVPTEKKNEAAAAETATPLLQTKAVAATEARVADAARTEDEKKAGKEKLDVESPKPEEGEIPVKAVKTVKGPNGGHQAKPGHEEDTEKGPVTEKPATQDVRLPDAMLSENLKTAEAGTINPVDKGALKTAVTEKVASPVAGPTGGENPKAVSAEVAAKAQELPGGSGDGNRDATFDQIVLGLRGKLDARNGKAEIQLNPPNLGSLRVSVNLANGTLTAQFQSDNASVRDLLLSQMDKLRSVLEGQGLAVDKLAVSPQANAGASGPQSVLPSQRFPDSANPDGRSGGNHGYSGQQQRQDLPRDRSFAAIWQEARESPIDLVA